jgi:NADPH2:quinone reductase
LQRAGDEKLMRAVVCRSFAADGAKIEQVPVPDVGPKDVCVAVKAAGVGFANILVLQGKHQNTPKLPFIPGTEAAGEVVACGLEVRNFKVGDRVVASHSSGGFAEFAVAEEANVRPISAGMSFDHATQFTTIYATAYGALRWQAEIQPGEWVLITGAAGASGLSAVEVAKAMGARIIGIAGGAEKCAIVRDHGGDHAIDHQTCADLRAEVLALTGGAGVNVVYDPVGGEMFKLALRMIAMEGRIITQGFASGDIPQIPANILLMKNASVFGIYWGYYAGWAKHLPPQRTLAKVRLGMAELFQWYDDGLLKPKIHGVYPLEKFAEALAVIANRQATGKLVLSPEI